MLWWLGIPLLSEIMGDVVGRNIDLEEDMPIKIHKVARWDIL